MYLKNFSKNIVIVIRKNSNKLQCLVPIIHLTLTRRKIYFGKLPSP